ncbi:MAG TPA: ATP-dependent zinc metalloprotease FtsH [Candidatus Blautia gallistercoris]|uniref:ATP-dependent zinc metalloprotease FtsH n=1 Tax=Candidatus Blautia gallistercoris TaxID=2838490 RepID=A0A9D1WJ31_9FIRM|nr:ATP-dependent zinc metalloprotease FtsH [Candidatus Blautia gallistercoris]
MNEVKTPKKPLISYYLIVLICLFLFNALAMPWLAERRIKEVDYGTFIDMTEEGDVEQVEIQEQSNTILFTDKEENIYKTAMVEDGELTTRLHDAGIEFYGQEIEQMSPIFSFVLSWVLPILIFIGIGQYMSKKLMNRAGGKNAMAFGMGKSNAKMYVKSSEGIRFSDVAGEDEAKENLAEIVDYLHNPGKYKEIGASMPKGILLVGPPGTGKTMLAKAVAGEANVPFFSMSGSEFVEMFVGMGASKVRDLFSQAKEKAPCIVFIDEIDAIGKKRDGQVGGNDEREQTLNQLLTEMDGFEDNTGVIILAATNRPESLDPALLRPGRFDRRVPVELPDLKGREDILKVHARKIKVSSDVDFNKIARMASGASGAELANIVNEAALRAVRDGRSFATQADLEESIEVVIAGYQKKNAILTDREKRIVAYHEIGHALVAARQSNSAPVQKITIVPRTSGALGYTMQVEEGEHYLMSREELENKIATYTGGRAAEEIVFGSETTGAANDIEQATKLARAMITRYGMNREFDMVALETQTNQYLGGDTSLACSAETQREVDKKVVELVKRQHEKAAQILMENREKLDELSLFLYERETITGEEFMKILNA